MSRAECVNLTTTQSDADKLIENCQENMSDRRSDRGLGVTSGLHCCVPLCVSDARYDAGMNFHRIPKDEALKKQWIKNIRRDEGEFFRITHMTVVCSNHFKREDYRWTPVRKCLKAGAVPTVFDWSSDTISWRSSKRKILRELSPTPSTSECDTGTSSSTNTDTHGQAGPLSTAASLDTMKNAPMDQNANTHIPADPDKSSATSICDTRTQEQFGSRSLPYVYIL